MHGIKRTVLVTGASSGIGRAIARQLLNNGHYVIGTSRDCQKFTHNHPRFNALEIDFASLKDITPKVKVIIKEHRTLDCVIFSAGYGKFGSLEQFSLPQIEALMTVNFTSQVFLTRALIAHLKKQGHSQLIYIGSEAALKGSRKGSIYCASKFALRGFTQALRDECGTSSVRVSLINPGMVDTPFFDELTFQPGNNEKHALSANDIADAVTYIINSGRHGSIDEINLNPTHKVIQLKK